jgi:hypothetical protein
LYCSKFLNKGLSSCDKGKEVRFCAKTKQTGNFRFILRLNYKLPPTDNVLANCSEFMKIAKGEAANPGHAVWFCHDDRKGSAFPSFP